MEEELYKYIDYIKKKHGNQKRKLGNPYYEHPISVANMIREKGYPIDYQIVALLHDTLEDTDATYEEIAKLSNENIADMVVKLTKEPGYNPEEYLNRILVNDITRIVKVADRIHNLRESIMLDDEDFINKYIEESDQFLYLLAEGTVFEEEFLEAVEAVKHKANKKSL